MAANPPLMRTLSRSASEREELFQQSGRRNQPETVENPLLNELDVNGGSRLTLTSVQLHLAENREAHHTSEYDHQGLIVRRGQSFKVTVTFKEEFDSVYNDVIIQLAIGNNPKETKGTLLRLWASTKERDLKKGKFGWFFASQEISSHSVEAIVTVPADAIIGRYTLYIETLINREGGYSSSRKKLDDKICVLFNPWCKDDVVYLTDEQERYEYVLNETGRIWQEDHDFGRPWNFGQFEDVCLEAALYLLDFAGLATSCRSDPTYVCRTISAMVNADDEGGVLGGKWGEPYPGLESQKPWQWSGSVGILQRYMATHRSVLWGQCWVFSGVATTLLRALGIPTRSVTNFSSAHDKNADVRIDMVFDEDGKPLNSLSDSVWTYHVWNESWFRRPDLPEGYDGWQAHDATPQEASDGVTRCGPAPVRAIKTGAKEIGFDTAFIFAEVNGDRWDWTRRRDGSMVCTSHSKHLVGRSVSTKAVGSCRRLLLTSDYKYEEGSQEERDAVRRVFGDKPGPQVEDDDGSDDDTDGPSAPGSVPSRRAQVSLDLVTPETVCLGQGFDVRVKLTNRTFYETRTVKCRLTACVSFYTGVGAKEIGTMLFNEVLQAKEEKVCSLFISPRAYLEYLGPDSVVTMYLSGTVSETGKTYVDVETIQITKPEVQVQAPERVALHQTFNVEVTFVNPLEEMLTGGTFSVEASGLCRPFSQPFGRDVEPRGRVTLQFPLAATRYGAREIVVNLSTDQVAGVTGAAEVMVHKST